MKTKNEWLDDMELRLKRGLLDVIDLGEDEARLFLQQEIRSHLEDVQGDAVRFEYLSALRERFPQLSNSRASSEVAVEPVHHDRVAAAPLAVTIEQAMEIVHRDWAQLDESAQQEFLQAIAPPAEVVDSAEAVSVSADATLQQPTDELARFLKLSTDSPLSIERLQNALISLLKSVSQVDSLGTQVFKQVGLSRDLSAEDIRKLVGQYISGVSVEVDHLNRILDETRLKVGLIISSIADLPTSLSQSHLSKFQPSMIEQSVEGGGGFLANKEAKYWKKYVALAEDIQPQKIEKAINDLIVKQLKKLKRR